MKLTSSFALVLPLAGSACNGSTPTAATETTTVAAPTVSETFSGSLSPGSGAFYAFTVGAYGTINATLTSIGGTAVPSTTWMGLGLGTPSGEDCVVSSSTNTQAGGDDTVHLTGIFDPGVYCVRVYDIGNMAGPATFTVALAHP